MAKKLGKTRDRVDTNVYSAYQRYRKRYGDKAHALARQTYLRMVELINEGELYKAKEEFKKMDLVEDRMVVRIAMGQVVMQLLACRTGGDLGRENEMDIYLHDFLKFEDGLKGFRQTIMEECLHWLTQTKEKKGFASRFSWLVDGQEDVVPIEKTETKVPKRLKNVKELSKNSKKIRVSVSDTSIEIETKE